MIRAPFAFDGVDFIAFPYQDEIDLPAVGVSPILNGPVGKMRLQIFQDEVFPEDPVIIRSQWLPSPAETDKARVEPINLGHSDDLLAAAAKKGANQRHGVGDLQRPQMTFHGRPADPEGARSLGRLHLAAALSQEVLEKQGKLVRIAEGEKPLDIAGEKRIDPFPVEAGFLGFGQQSLGQAAVVESLEKRRFIEGVEFVPEDRGKTDKTLSSRQRILEFSACGKGGRTRGHDFQMGKQIGPDFQNHARVRQLMHLVEDDHRAGAIAVEKLGIDNPVACDRKITVDIDHPLLAETLCQCGFPRAPHPGEPADRRFPPGVFDAVEPEGS